MPVSYDEMLTKKKSVSTAPTSATSAWDAMKDPSADKAVVRAQLSMPKANPVIGKTVTAADLKKLAPIATTSQKANSGVGFGASPAKEENAFAKLVRHLGNSSDTTLPMALTNSNPEAQKQGQLIVGKAVSGAVGMTRRFVNEIGYLGQGAARGAYAREAARLKTQDAVKGTASPLTTQMQKTSAELSAQPLKSYVNFGQNYDKKLNEFEVENKFDQNKGLQMLGDIAQGAGGMVPAIVANYILPGSSLFVVATGAAGNATEEATKRGADTGSALAYGAAVGITEAATEKLFNGVAGVFGKGTADDVIKALVKRVSKDETTQKAVMALANVLGEGFEEWLTEYAEAYENKLLINQDSRSFKDVSSDALYSAAIGSLVSVVVQGGNIANLSAKDAGEIAADDTAAKVANNVQSTALTSANNVQNAIAPNLLKPTQNIAQDAPQAPVSDFSANPTTDTAKAVEANTAQQAKPEVQTKSENSLAERKQQFNSDIDKYNSDIEAVQQTQDKSEYARLQAERVRLQNEYESISAITRRESGAVSKTIDTAENHIDNRKISTVGSPKIKAFEFDHPQIHRYYVEAAEKLKNDIANASQHAGNLTATRTKEVQTLRDAGLLYSDMFDACERIIHDQGQENRAAAKRVEIVLDEMLSDGYKDYGGNLHEPSGEYISEKSKIYGGESEADRRVRQAKDSDEYVDGIEQHTPAAEELAQREAKYQQIRAKHTPKQSSTIFPATSLGAKITTPKQTTAESSVGAASKGFVPQTPYTAWSENTQSGQFHDVGEKSVRSVDLPKVNPQGQKTMKTAATVMESKNTTDARVEQIQSAMVDGKMAYIPVENNGLAQKANSKIESKGWQTSLNDWTSEVRGGRKVSPELVAEGATLLNNAGNAAECTKEAYINLLTDYANLVHASGQSLQAARILKMLTPEARLYAMQRSVQKINEGINQESGAKKQNTKTADENAKAVSDEITDEVVKKVKRKTASEKTDIDKAAERLASKVDGTTKTRKPVEVDAINDMVNELFKSAKESPLPEKAALAKRSPIEFLTQAIKNKAEYAETWNNAKEILLEKYANNQPVLDMLNDYFKKGIVPTYSDATLTSSVKQAIKDLDTKLSEIKELSWADRQKAIKAITNYLVEQTGAVDGDAKALRRDAADKITMLIINSAPKLTQKQKLEIKQATQDAMRNRGVPVESWEEETGRLLSENLSKRLDAPKTPKPTPITKTILGDLVKFAEEHALPSRQIAPKLNRTAAARITDFFNNRTFYAKAWNDAQNAMREKYADNQAVLDQFDEWLNSTIGYNADGTNAVMQKAVMDAAIEGDISLKQIRDNKALGNTDSVINRIYSKLAAEVKPEGADAITLKDAVTRFVTEKTAKVDADAQLERFIRSALKDINAKFSSVVGKPSAEKTAMQNTVTNMLIQKYGIAQADAEIVSKTIAAKFDEMFLNTMNEHTEIKIDADLAEKYRKATTDEERDAIVSKIQQNIADQVPSTALDKWTALRYVNMLGNFKTQMRNVAGNVTMAGVTKVKSEVAAGLEWMVSKASGGKLERTKSFAVSKELYSAAYADFKNVQKAALGESKYAESDFKSDFERGIDKKRTIFKVNGEWGKTQNSIALAKGARAVTDVGMKVLEGYRKITNQAMEVGDVIFSRITYADALAGYLKANGVTAEQVNSGSVDAALMDRARLYAIKEAQEATFRDTNAFSKAVSNFDRNWGKSGKVISKGILPFRKTPANIAVRAEEYSPLGLINTAVKSVQLAKGAENVSGADVINSLSKTITGSGILWIGYMLAKAGLLFGKEDDKDQAAFNSLTGRQDYSITLPNGMSFTVDWLTPASMPLFVGAALFDLTAEKGLKSSDVESAITSITDPIVKMSMMSGVNDALSNIKYADNNLIQFVLSSAANYLTQGLTNTMFGQIERTSEESRMTTYSDPTSLVPTWMQRIGGKASAKTPGVDYNQGEYVDAWGRTQGNGTMASKLGSNFFSPAYTSTVNETVLDKELQRLYDATGDGSVIPKRVTDTSISLMDGKYSMTTGEQVKFQKTRGQYAYKELDKLTNSTEYKAMSDEDKAKAVSDVYSDANYNARQTIVEAGGKLYIPNKTTAEKLQRYQSVGYTQKQAYNIYKTVEALDIDGDSSQVEVAQALEKSNLSNKDKGFVWEIKNGKPSEKNPYTGTLSAHVSPEKTIAIMEAYNTIDKTIDDNYVKQEGMPGAAQVKAAYLNQWLANQGYTSGQIGDITDVFTTWQMIPIDKPSSKANAFVSANPMPK